MERLLYQNTIKSADEFSSNARMLVIPSHKLRSQNEFDVSMYSTKVSGRDTVATHFPQPSSAPILRTNQYQCNFNINPVVRILYMCTCDILYRCECGIIFSLVQLYLAYLRSTSHATSINFTRVYVSKTE